MPRYRHSIAALATVGLLVTGLPAVAQTAPNVACLLSPDAGFADVLPVSVHKADIDCIKYWGITQQTGAYGPSEPVTRWQMALFLTRTFLIENSPLPDGAGQVFTDLGELPIETQLTINQLKRMGITSGVAPGVYDPQSSVPRWQMALFLTRLLTASGIPLPDGTGQGFVDLGALTADAQVAINQTRQLGIATGTSQTTFTPDDPVTREQMASFLARTINVMFSLPTVELDLACNQPPELQLPGTTCTGSLSWYAGVQFTIRESWSFTGPLVGPGFPFAPLGTALEVVLDGSSVVTTETIVVMEGLAYQYFAAGFPGGLVGSHTIEIRWIEDGVASLTITLTATFS